MLAEQRGAAAERVGGADALALVERVGGDVDEGLDVGVAGRGVGDDGAAVGVADEHDRAGDRREERAQVVGVRGDAAQRVGRARRRCSPCAAAARVTSDQLDASANAPCTRTIVGLGALRAVRARGAHGERGGEEEQDRGGERAHDGAGGAGRSVRAWWSPRVVSGGHRLVTSPPSMRMSMPVAFQARAPASRTTRSATSSGRVNRPVAESAAAPAAISSGVRPVRAAIVSATPPPPSHRSVATGPGLIVLTRTPSGPTSRDSDLLKLRQRRLRGAVVDDRRVGQRGVDRADRHDARRCARQQVRQRGARGPHGRHEVRRERPEPVLVGHRGEAVQPGPDAADVVDQHVEPAVRGDRGLDRAGRGRRPWTGRR